MMDQESPARGKDERPGPSEDKKNSGGAGHIRLSISRRRHVRSKGSKTKVSEKESPARGKDERPGPSEDKKNSGGAGYIRLSISRRRHVRSKGSKTKVSEKNTEDNEYLKLPIEQQCVHKRNYVRAHGYEEAVKLFRQITDENSPLFGKYLSLVKKFVKDRSMGAREKGCFAVLAFLQKCAYAGETVGDVMSGIVGKCIAARSAKTRELAVDIILMYIQRGRIEEIQKELLEGMDCIYSKTVVGCVKAATEALREFGPEVVNIKLLIEKVPNLLDNRHVTVKDVGKELVIEMYMCIGEALKPQLCKLKPDQLTELEAEFQKLEDESDVN